MIERTEEIRARLSRAIAGEISSIAFRSYAETDIPYLLDQITAKDAEIERLRAVEEAAKELAGYASYAEIVGGISQSRPQIRKWCDVVFNRITAITTKDAS